MWREEDEVAPSEIARRLRIAKSTLTRLLALEVPRGTQNLTGSRVTRSAKVWRLLGAGQIVPR